MSDQVADLRPLSAGDLAGLEMLRADRDGENEGVLSAPLARVVGTLYLGSFFRRLRARRIVVGELAPNLYTLVSEPASTEASRASAPAAHPPRAGSSGASVDAAPGRLFRPPSVPHHREDVAA